MASTQHVLLSPAELAYLHDALSLTPPIRPDGRNATQFRPLTAETGILPGTNGSARICFADGTEAIVGAKAEVEKTQARLGPGGVLLNKGNLVANDRDDDDDDDEGALVGEWVEITVEIPGFRDDDAVSVFLAAMLSEALLADDVLASKLRINRRFHWKLYLDILLISPPLSYPLPLLSLTAHLALLATRLPKLKSEGDEDPLFDDDWHASTFLYPRAGGRLASRPPVTLVVMAVGPNVIFDPSKDELAVADSALAVSVGVAARTEASEDMDVDSAQGGRKLRLLSIRTIDPPSRLTAPGVPNSANITLGGGLATAKPPEARQLELETVEGVWKPPRGGAKRQVMAALVQKVLEPGGVADEVFDGLDGVEVA